MTEKVNLLDRVRQVIRVENYSYRTEQAYATRIKQCILYHDTGTRPRWGSLR